MTELEERNQKIIDAIVKKADQCCPGVLELIGIYGSFRTGDVHRQSDLDLLILIRDDRGWQLASCFIQDDLQVGHDLYCTTWESLRSDAQYLHPNISKLMDSEIVYCTREACRGELEALRNQAREILSAPFSQEDYAKAENMLREAEHAYAMAMTAETRSQVLVWTGTAICHVEYAIAMLNKQYFRFGIKRTCEELSAMRYRPENLVTLLEQLLSASTVAQVRERLSVLMRETLAVFSQVKRTLSPEKQKATPETLRGTYEEMFSNWRNKMYLAAETGDRHLAFMSMNSLQAMLSDIHCSVGTDLYDVLDGYDPENLHRTAQAVDRTLDAYLREYRKANLQPRHYADVDSFVQDYLR